MAFLLLRRCQGSQKCGVIPYFQVAEGKGVGDRPEESQPLWEVTEQARARPVGAPCWSYPSLGEGTCHTHESWLCAAMSPVTGV